MELQVNHQYFSGDKPLIIPHRGGAKVVPENTLDGLNFISAEKFSHFETDLRMSKDGVIFLHHDDTFDRTTNVKGKVNEFTWHEVQKINAGYKFYQSNNQPEKSTEFVRLEDALVNYSNLKFNLDLKQAGMAEKLFKILKKTNSLNRVLVSSFSPKRLDEFRKVSKGQVLTSGSFRENFIAKFTRIKKRDLGIAALQAPYIWRGLKVYSKKLVNFCTLNKLQLHVWAVNTIQEFDEVLNTGCDGVITDDPIIFRNHIAKTI